MLLTIELLGYALVLLELFGKDRDINNLIDHNRDKLIQVTRNLGKYKTKSINSNRLWLAFWMSLGFLFSMSLLIIQAVRFHEMIKVIDLFTMNDKRASALIFFVLALCAIVFVFKYLENFPFAMVYILISPILLVIAVIYFVLKLVEKILFTAGQHPEGTLGTIGLLITFAPRLIEHGLSTWFWGW